MPSAALAGVGSFVAGAALASLVALGVDRDRDRSADTAPSEEEIRLQITNEMLSREIDRLDILIKSPDVKPLTVAPAPPKAPPAQPASRVVRRVPEAPAGRPGPQGPAGPSAPRPVVVVVSPEPRPETPPVPLCTIGLFGMCIVDLPL